MATDRLPSKVVAAHEAASDRLVDTAGAAGMMKVQPQTLALWRCTGRYGLPYVKVGRSIRYRVSDIEAWLRGRTVAPTT